MMTNTQFLALVEKHLAESETTATRFGKEVLGDPSFVFELRGGRQPNLTIVNRVLDFIAKSSKGKLAEAASS